MDSSGRRLAKEAKERAGSHGPAQPGSTASQSSGSLETEFELCNCLNELRTELAKGRAVCRLTRENYEVDASKVAKNVKPNQLAKATLEAIPSDDSPAPLRNHNCSPWMCERGRDRSDVKGLGPNALPLSKNRCELCLTRQAVSPRKNEFVRRWRTSMAT